MPDPISTCCIWRSGNTWTTRGRARPIPKNAADVRGGGKKPFKQKGTGRARQGSTRSSIMVGGYVAHGPEPRDHSWELPKKSRQAALRSAWSDGFKSGKLGVIESLKTTGKTKEMVELLKIIEMAGQKVLLLDETHSLEVRKSGRNIPGLVLKPVREVNPYDIIKADKVILTRKGLEAVKEAFSQMNYRIIIRPLITEKITNLREKFNRYGFEVSRDANKHQIKQAVETLFKVKVTEVTTMNVMGKTKRLGRNQGKRPDWKKAIVTLAKDQKIEMIEGI